MLQSLCVQVIGNDNGCLGLKFQRWDTTLETLYINTLCSVSYIITKLYIIETVKVREEVSILLLSQEFRD